jgi:hypothetical protein
MYVRRRNAALQQRFTYKDLHDYLAKPFRAWYTKFKPSSSAVVSEGLQAAAGDPKLGAVVQVEGVDRAAPPPKKLRYSLTLNDDPCVARQRPVMRPLRPRMKVARTLLTK